MNHVEAEGLRANCKNWHWGIVYKCSEDPRLIVRNRYFFGWTWNFGHPKVFLGISAAALFAIGVPYLFVATGFVSLSIALASFLGCVIVLMIIANGIANGPR